MTYECKVDSDLSTAYESPVDAENASKAMSLFGTCKMTETQESMD